MVNIMRKIPLTQGKFALVDDEDFEFVSQYKWCAYWKEAHYYVMHKDKGTTVHMHSFILGTTSLVDHRNGDGLDNRKSNLRITSDRTNALNSDRSRSAKIVEKHGNRWRVRPFVDGRRTNLGSFSSLEEATKIAEEYKLQCKR
jgi:hypothetical protein